MTTSPGPIGAEAEPGPHLLLMSPLTDTFTLSCLQLLSPNIWHPPWSKLEDNPDDATKTNQPMAPPRLPQASDQNQPPTHALPTIIEAAKHPTFDNIPEIQLQQANMSTTATGTSWNDGGASSTQTNGGDRH
jgi:hypothetical protein